MKEAIDNFLYIVRFLLDFDGIVYEINDDFLEKNRLLSSSCVEEKRILLRSSYQDDMDLFFRIAYEARHIRQCHQEILSDSLAEIDANAFASVCMQQIYGLVPLFTNLPRKSVSEIRSREKLLLAELDQRLKILKKRKLIP